MGNPENSKLAQYAYGKGHRIGCGKARILESESNSRYRKYKDLAPSPIWIPLSAVRLSTLRDHYDVTGSS
jgi:hypothetical protein